jgi:hypothetical protein
LPLEPVYVAFYGPRTINLDIGAARFENAISFPADLRRLRVMSRQGTAAKGRDLRHFAPNVE